MDASFKDKKQPIKLASKFKIPGAVLKQIESKF